MYVSTVTRATAAWGQLSRPHSVSDVEALIKSSHGQWAGPKPYVAVALRLDHLAPEDVPQGGMQLPLVMVAFADKARLEQGYRAVSVRSLLGLTRLAALVEKHGDPNDAPKDAAADRPGAYTRYFSSAHQSTDREIVSSEK